MHVPQVSSLHAHVVLWKKPILTFPEVSHGLKAQIMFLQKKVLVLITAHRF
jgi:hypothetical protein